MPQGLEKEDDIADTFRSKMEADGKHGFSFTKCGLLISKTHEFLGSSPDRIIQDPSEESPGVAEFKYLQVKENETLLDVLLRQNICVKGNKGNYTSLLVNKKHKCFFSFNSKCSSGNYTGEFLSSRELMETFS